MSLVRTGTYEDFSGSEAEHGNNVGVGHLYTAAYRETRTASVNNAKWRKH